MNILSNYKKVLKETFPFCFDLFKSKDDDNPLTPDQLYEASCNGRST